MAFATHHLRLNGNFLTDPEHFHPGTYGVNNSGNLMSLSNGVRGEWMRTMVNVDIGTTDTQAHHSNGNLTRPRYSSFDFPENNFSRLGHDLLQHMCPPYFSPTITLIDSLPICIKMASFTCSTG